MRKQSSTRSQVRAALAAVDDLIPAPWDLELFIRRLARRHHRPIQLRPVAFPRGAVSGLWLPVEGADLILYDAAAPLTLKEQIIGHEIGHMIMNHHEFTGASGSVALSGELLISAISPDLVERFLARTVYADRIEAAAEEFGTRLLQAARRRRPTQSADPLGRLTDSLR